MLVLENNKFVRREDVNIDIEDRGYQFGDGVYEVIRVYEGRPYEIDGHIHRFYRSLDAVGIHTTTKQRRVKQKLINLISKNQLIDGGIYFQMTRGVAQRNHHYEKEISP